MRQGSTLGVRVLEWVCESLNVCVSGEIMDQSSKADNTAVFAIYRERALPSA